MLYLTYAQGYKGPAFNTFFNMGTNDILPIGAEESDAVELGWKFTADTFLLNVSVFQTDIENFQANNFDAPAQGRGSAVERSRAIRRRATLDPRRERNEVPMAFVAATFSCAKY